MKKIITFLFFQLVSGIVFCQTSKSILTILEKDPDQLYIKHGANFTNKNFADINSTLLITINKENIVGSLTQTGAIQEGLPEDIENVIKVLDSTLAQQAAFMSRFRNAIKDYNRRDTGEAAKAFGTVMKDLGKQVLRIQSMDPRIKQYAIANPSIYKYVPFFEAVKRRLNELTESETMKAKAGGNIVQLGAWLIRDTTPVPLHLRGFDNIPEGAFYELARWNFLPTKEQIDELISLRNKSNQNSLELNAIFKAAVDSLKAQLTEALTQLNADKVLEIFQILKENQAGIASDLNANIKELDTMVRADAAFILERVKYYAALRSEAINLVTLTEQVITDVEAVNAKVKELSAKIFSFKTNIDNGMATTNTNTKKALTDLQNYFTQLPGEVKKTLALIDVEDFRNLKNHYQFDINALVFSDNVLKLSLREMPVSAELNLRKSGLRSPGDHVVIRLTVRNEADKKLLISPEQDIELQMLASHVESTVGIVLAAPVSPTPLKNGVQVTPYYNILFKGFRANAQKNYREKGNNNNPFAMSFGIHASIPDFNLDGVPEIGVGGVVSFLKDFVQAGWAYNFFESTGYWFFGTRFPIGPFGFNNSAAVKNAAAN